MVRSKHGGMVPGRKEIYVAQIRGSLSPSVRSAADLGWYFTVHESLLGKPVLSYPDRVHELLRAWHLERSLGLPSAAHTIHEVEFDLSFTVEQLSELSFEDLTRVRADFSPRLRSALAKMETDPAGVEDPLRELVGATDDALSESGAVRRKRRLAKIAIWAVGGVGAASSVALLFADGHGPSLELQVATAASTAFGAAMYSYSIRDESTGERETARKVGKSILSRTRETNRKLLPGYVATV